MPKQPSASSRQLFELVEFHLETAVLTNEVVRVAIGAAVVGRLNPRQGELFAEGWPNDPHQQALLVNRLSSRLGGSQVLRAELRASPLPERAVHYVPMTEKSRVKGPKSKDFGSRISDCGLKNPNPQCRPLLLYSQPRPIEVTCVAPDGPPRTVWLGDHCEPVARYWGPERIETLWWRGPSVRRDYYRAAMEAGGHFWIFRRLDDGHWFLHGVFT